MCKSNDQNGTNSDKNKFVPVLSDTNDSLIIGNNNNDDDNHDGKSETDKLKFENKMMIL
jgi:hypothetical protein